MFDYTLLFLPSNVHIVRHAEKKQYKDSSPMLFEIEKVRVHLKFLFKLTGIWFIDCYFRQIRFFSTETFNGISHLFCMFY